MPITCAVKIVRLKVYSMTIASPMTLTLIQGHKFVSNLTIFLTCNIYIGQYLIFYIDG